MMLIETICPDVDATSIDLFIQNIYHAQKLCIKIIGSLCSDTDETENFSLETMLSSISNKCYIKINEIRDI